MKSSEKGNNIAYNRDMDKGSTTAENRRISIGFLIQYATGFGGFQDIVWSSMVQAAKERDVNAFVFAGGSIDNASYNPFEKNLNIVYDLIDKEHLDGLVINYTVGNFINPERFENFCRRFNLPIVSIIGSIRGFPDVHVDNKKSMRETILHLVENHHLKQISFIKGSQGNQDAEERYQIYRDTLAECGIPYDPDLVYNGEFDEDSGMRAVDFFIRQKKKKIEAVVASNDAMALGAINGLRRAGIKVPWDVAVTGFDNTDEAKAFNPSLTTVQQPFAEICGKAVEMLCDMIGGKNRSDSVAVPAKLVVRQSCGCSSMSVRQAQADGKKPVLSRTNLSPGDKAAVIEEMRRCLLETGIKKDLKTLEYIIDDFIGDVTNKRPGAFLANMKKIFQEEMTSDEDVLIWQSFIFELRKWIYSLWSDHEVIFAAEGKIIQACILIGESSKQTLAYQKIVIEKKSKQLREVAQELSTTFDFNQLKEVIRSQLEKLNIQSCFISVFSNSEGKDDKSEIFLAHTDEKAKDLEIKPLQYNVHSLPDRQVFPPARRFTYAVHPLCFKNHKLGYAMFELGPEDGIVYDALQVQISSSLMGSELFRQSEKTETMLKQRSETIRELVRPMLDSIHTVTNTAREKIGVIGGLIELTKENSEKLNSTNQSIKLMSEKIGKMSDVMKIIDDILDAVNILAINTAIESAHAGAYGKGFAIIAGEIRKLAESIKTNAGVISDSLIDIRPNIEISRKAGNKSLEAFRRLEKDVLDVAQTLQQITQAMDDLTENSSRIVTVMNVS
jgi:DNA-binding LacI/PurR family transcriptional regulator